MVFGAHFTSDEPTPIYIDPKDGTNFWPVVGSYEDRADDTGFRCISTRPV